MSFVDYKFGGGGGRNFASTLKFIFVLSFGGPAFSCLLSTHFLFHYISFNFFRALLISFAILQ